MRLANQKVDRAEGGVSVVANRKTGWSQGVPISRPYMRFSATQMPPSRALLAARLRSRSARKRPIATNQSKGASQVSCAVPHCNTIGEVEVSGSAFSNLAHSRIKLAIMATHAVHIPMIASRYRMVLL